MSVCWLSGSRAGKLQCGVAVPVIAFFQGYGGCLQLVAIESQDLGAVAARHHQVFRTVRALQPGDRNSGPSSSKAFTSLSPDHPDHHRPLETL